MIITRFASTCGESPFARGWIALNFRLRDLKFGLHATDTMDLFSRLDIDLLIIDKIFDSESVQARKASCYEISFLFIILKPGESVDFDSAAMPGEAQMMMNITIIKNELEKKSPNR